MVFLSGLKRIHLLWRGVRSLSSVFLLCVCTAKGHRFRMSGKKTIRNQTQSDWLADILYLFRVTGLDFTKVVTGQKGEDAPLRLIVHHTHTHTSGQSKHLQSAWMARVTFTSSKTTQNANNILINTVSKLRDWNDSSSTQSSADELIVASAANCYFLGIDRIDLEN